MKKALPSLESIKAATIGRGLHTCNSWNCLTMSITVEAVECLPDSYSFTGTNAWCGKSVIFVDNEYIADLIATGEAEHHQEIDHCDVCTKWVLK